MRRIGAAAVAAVLSAVLAGCVSPPPPRTVPNRVEIAALVTAGNFFRPSPGARRWVQLWTPAQMPHVVEDCISTESNGVLRAQLLFQGGGLGLEYDYGNLSSASSDDLRRFSDGAEIDRLAAACVSATPVDDRALHLPRSSWDELYSYDVTFLRRCLMAHGQKVAQPPSRARFERLLRAKAPWSPYDHVVVRDRATWYALSDACPALPPSLAARR